MGEVQAMMRHVLAALVLPALIASTACENRLFIDVPEAEPPDFATEKLTQYGYYWVEYEPMPAPIPYNDYFELTFYVDDAEGDAPIPDAALDVIAFMPHDGSPHGMSTVPTIEPIGDGGYEVRGMLFHMTGIWNVDVYIEKEGLLDATRFNVECCASF